MTPEKIKVARNLYQARDLTVEEIAKTIGVSRKTVYRHLIDPPTEASAHIA
jgi:DNA-binding XRE family transcriptional regulator